MPLLVSWYGQINCTMECKMGKPHKRENQASGYGNSLPYLGDFSINLKLLQQKVFKHLTEIENDG